MRAYECPQPLFKRPPRTPRSRHGLKIAYNWLHEKWNAERWAALRFVGDEPADAVLRAGLGGTKTIGQSLEPLAEVEKAAEGSFEGAEESKQLTLSAKRLLSDFRTVPAWVDFRSIRRAQAFFARHMSLASLSLLHVGLVGGFGAPLIHPTLEATGYLTDESHPRKTHRRIFETMHFVHECLGEPLSAQEVASLQSLHYSSPSPSASSLDENSARKLSGLDVGGRGWRACAKVRLLHAAVRRRIFTRESRDATTNNCAGTDRDKSSEAETNQHGYWPMDRLGVPICQADLTATQLAFSCCVLIGLANSGVGFTRREANDMVHWWRYVGHLLGIREENNACAPPEATLQRKNSATSDAAACTHSSLLLFSWPWKSRLSTSSNNLPSCDAFDAAIAATEMVTEHMLVPGPDGTYSGSQRLGRNVLTALSSAWPLDRMGNSLAPHFAWSYRLLGPSLALHTLGVRRIGLLEGFRVAGETIFSNLLTVTESPSTAEQSKLTGSAEETSHSRQKTPALLTYSSIPRDAAVSAIILAFRALAWLGTVSPRLALYFDRKNRYFLGKVLGVVIHNGGVGSGCPAYDRPIFVRLGCPLANR